MPGKVKVKILAGRNLPVMDRSSDTTDAYVEIKLGNTTYKTEVYRKSLNPQWNSDWYRYELDDSELQDEPLQIRLMDHDTYSANDAIGKVYLDLNPLLLPSVMSTKSNIGSDSLPTSTGISGGATMAGWIPVFDTMHGIRGEVNLIVKVELFSDFNKFRQSSCGVQFFCSSMIPQGYHAQIVHGFVEELVVNDDPEYQWIDKIRTPRASNEARQTLFLKLSGEVQRKIGLKALDLGGNAVIGYQQCFDLEGESGIVVRGIGTAVTLIKQHDILLHHAGGDQGTACDDRNVGDDLPPVERHVEVPLPLPATYKACPSPSRLPNASSICRRSSDSDLSITPKGNSLTSSDRSSTVGSHLRPPSVRPTMNQENLDMLEYPFLTMSKYPPGFVQHLGGTVSSRSVKLLERIMNLEEPESRDLWWTELRMEVRSHARALGCNVVLGYTEQTSIYDDVCVLSASGTAAIINLESGDIINQPLIVRQYLHTKELMTTSLDRTDFEKEKNPIVGKSEDSAPMTCTKLQDTPENQCDIEGSTVCSMCHIPYSEGSMPYSATMQKCRICRRGKVPDVLFTTIDLPEGIPTTGKGCFLQSYVCRQKRLLKGELNAKEISDGLPFLEYELHRVLLNKLKLIGMNAIFGLKVQVAIGEKMLIGLATGTAVYLTPLPTPPVPKISSGNAWKDDKKLTEVQKTVMETIKKNREFYNLKLVPDTDSNVNGRQQTSDTDESEEEMPDMDLAAGNKDTWILEVDDSEDVDKIKTLIEPTPPEGFHIVNIENVPGLEDFEVTQNLQMFTQVWRAKISSNETHCGSFSHHINRLLRSVFFKLRRSAPCALMKVQFRVELPEIDEVQLSVLGMSLGLSEVDKQMKARQKLMGSPNTDVSKKSDDPDLIFNLEYDNETCTQQPSTSFAKQPNITRFEDHSKIPESGDKLINRERYGVDITPLSYIPGGHIDRYLGNLNFFFIRESTSIREGGGLSGFVHSFMTEVLAIVRAHVTALGGNAMVAYFMSECVLYHNPHKNQGQCLINVGGDVVLVSYYKDD